MDRQTGLRDRQAGLAPRGGTGTVRLCGYRVENRRDSIQESNIGESLAGNLVRVMWDSTGRLGAKFGVS